jgi:anti-sigma factor RsiW
MSTADEMACNELVAVITDYLEGILPESDRRRFEAHLETCPYCVTYLGQMRETIEAMGELTVDAIAPEVRREVLEAFAGWRGR